MCCAARPALAAPSGAVSSDPPRSSRGITVLVTYLANPPLAAKGSRDTAGQVYNCQILSAVKSGRRLHDTSARVERYSK